ncbi:hypothetical protein RFI_23427 [Reticulomyxa filosa]|uniref:Uncharacterized protein n=1 Tax=Reticulomyxa filosa TaxID=46433 RepID=X6MJY0_RETFI|nr:hypothetical protein RFI_23427 [Reticulomyxa filosa]|eukprot:ETO13941.1 hypothetical protein RFI_23427 [Reticulomyxa filosa]
MTDSTFWRKLCGLRVHDYELLRISNPTAELRIHTLFKCTEFGTLVGLVTGHVFSIVKRNKSEKGIFKRLRQPKTVRFATKCGLVGMCSGIVLSQPFYEYCIHFRKPGGFTQGEIYDQAFQLRHNSYELSMHRATIIGLVLGVAMNRRKILFGLPWGVAGSLLIVIAFHRYNIIRQKLAYLQNNNQNTSQQLAS